MHGGHKVLGRTVFLQIVNAFTKGDQKIKVPVDYTLGVLLYDNVAPLSDILRKDISDGDMLRPLNLRLNTVSDYITFGYSTHIGTDDNPVHDIKNFILKNTGFEWEVTKASTYRQCATPCQSFL